jgi:UDP-glucuronate 4-epimerase
MGCYLVTGAAGFVASHLAESLVADGHQVIGADCFTKGYPRAIKEQNVSGLRLRDAFELFECDLATDDLSELAADIDGIFHLAAQPGVRQSWREFDVYLRNNLLATQRILDAATATGTRLVFASSSSVYGEASTYPTGEGEPTRPIAPYGVTKLAGEQLAHAAAVRGLEAVVLRYFTVYGPRQRPDMAFARLGSALLLGEEFETYGDGSQTRDVTYVGDVVTATRLAMDAAPAGAIYNVGGGHEISLNEVIALYESLAGTRLNTRRVAQAAGDVRRTASDTSLIRGELGWSPQTGLGEGARAHLDWMAADADQPAPLEAGR